MSDLRKLLDEVDGPWRVEDEHGRGTVLAKHGYEVCWDATARDARLIALAPDLAAALLKAEEALEYYADSDNWLRNSDLDAEGPCWTGGPARATLTEIHKLTGAK